MDGMATASPTPMSQGSHFSSLGRRTSARQALRRPSSRPQLSRSESNPVSSSASAVVKEAKAQSQQFSTLNDSSDDEIPVPMKLSALTKALLNDGASASVEPSMSTAGAAPADRPAQSTMTRRRSVLNRSTSSATTERESDGPNVRQTRRHVRAGSVQVPSSRPVSPVRSRESSPVPRKRVVRLSTTPAGGGLQNQLRRSLSASKHGKRPPSRDNHNDKNQVSEPPADVNTPANGVRRVQIAIGSSGSKARSSGSSAVSSKRSASAHQSDHEMPEDPATVNRPQGSVSRFGTGARGKESDAALQSSMRIKRMGKVPGSFLSGPARRGKRRQSDEEENSPVDENGDGEPLVTGREPESQVQDGDPAASSFYAPYVRDFAASGSPVSAKDSARAALRKQPSRAEMPSSPQGPVNDQDLPPPAYFKPPLPRPDLPSSHDQENELPYGLKGLSKHAVAKVELDRKPLLALSAGPGALSQPSGASPERKVLSQISKNTPHRPAPPPPPKMTVLETATATAGAATTTQASKKQRVLLKVNGRSYQRVDCIGRGGSAKVYKVTAENGKIFALKRVSIENADETTIKGYLGEIDLLQKLSGVDRVIQLFDCEMNKEKHILSLLMELGELDLNSLLRVRQNPEGSKLDPVFIRFYWKEMLECLQAVHAHDIVHSDLKPANFVLVRGRLKLIDFGIANAIQTDETVNVHRENQIGTPNYMSPESLMDSQQYAITSANNGRWNLPQGLKGPKLMKLGKPSDVWSLGCILYQMVYGQPPFAHIQNQMARCQAIINWSHAVDFPEKGLGGALVPPSLFRTMKKCLNREQHLRPTCDQLLSETDPFLYPQEYDLGASNGMPITEELLSRIIGSVVARCRERMPTDGEAMSAWAAAYWASVRRAVVAKDGKS